MSIPGRQWAGNIGPDGEAARAHASSFPVNVNGLPTADEVEQVLCERRLSKFIRSAWPQMDPSVYDHGWHIDAISEHLGGVVDGSLGHLIINIPPRCMKSLSVAVAFPAWVWCRPHRFKGQPLSGPQVRFLFSSYAQTLSIRDSTKCRRLIDSDWYQSRWGDRFHIVDDQNTKIKYETNFNGYRMATSTEGALTGEGGDLIVIDDPHNAQEISSVKKRDAVLIWWDEAMSTRINDKRFGRFIVVMQRLHDRDLTGHILAKEHSDWTHLCLPMRYDRHHKYHYFKDPRSIEGELLWENHIPEKQAKELEKSLGSYGSAGQLQQLPAPREGGMFKKSWFKKVGAVPAGSLCVRSWDLASTEQTSKSLDPDWTVGGRIWKDREGRFYIRVDYRDRESSLKVDQAIRNHASVDGKKIHIVIPQDPGQAGKAQVADFARKLAGWVLFSQLESGSKEVRANPWAVQAEAGNIFLVGGGDESWIEDFLDEVCVFPNGAHDDQVDMVSSGFNYICDQKVPIVAAAIGVPLAAPPGFGIG